MALHDLNGKWVLVTGAASGIGHETALAFAREGANLLAIDLDVDRLAETVRLISGMGRRCLPFACDVSDSAAVDALATKVTADVGSPHVLVNNAGIGFLG